MVLPILVFQRTGSALQTSLLLTIEAVPYLVLGLWAGAPADRLDRRRLMIGCELVSALAVGSVPAANAAGRLSGLQIYAAALVVASVWVFFDAAEFGALPAIAGRERIVNATSLLSATDTALLIVGPAIAGTLAATVGAALALGIDALSYLAAAALLARVRREFGTAGVRPSQPLSVAASVVEGLRYLWGHRLIRTLTLLGSGNSLTVGAVVGLLVVYAVRGLGLPANDARIGVLYSCGAGGALLASAALPRLSRRVPPGWVGLLGLTSGWILAVGLALAHGFALAAAVYVLWQAAATLTILNGITYRQRVTPDELQGRVNVVARMIAWGGQPLGAAIGGALAAAMDVRRALLLASLGVGLSALAGWLGPLARTDLG